MATGDLEADGALGSLLIYACTHRGTASGLLAASILYSATGRVKRSRPGRGEFRVTPGHGGTACDHLVDAEGAGADIACHGEERVRGSTGATEPMPTGLTSPEPLAVDLGA
jgi:hypothetical protein